MPPNRQFKITDARSGAAITVRVVAQSLRTEVAGLQEEEGLIKIRLVAPAVDLPDANQELVQFLASKLNVEPRAIEIVAGTNSRDKIVTIEGMNKTQVEQILRADAVE